MGGQTDGPEGWEQGDRDGEMRPWWEGLLWDSPQQETYSGCSRAVEATTHRHARATGGVHEFPGCIPRHHPGTFSAHGWPRHEGGVCVHMPVHLGREAVWAPTGYGHHTGQMHTSGVQAARSLPTGRSTPGSECAPALGAQKTLFPRVRPPPHRSLPLAQTLEKALGLGSA